MKASDEHFKYRGEKKRNPHKLRIEKPERNYCNV